MALAGQKRKHSNSTTAVSVVKGWPSNIVRWIWGMRDDSDDASRVRAEALITHGGKIYCNGCGRQYQAHKSDFEEHLETDTCSMKRGKGFRFDERGNDAMPRGANPVTPARIQHHAEHGEKRLMMLSAVLLGHGIGY